MAFIFAFIELCVWNFILKRTDTSQAPGRFDFNNMRKPLDNIDNPMLH